MEKPWHSRPYEEILSELRTSDLGLSPREAEKRIRQFGANVIQTAKGPSLFYLFIRQFFNPLIFILLGAAFIKLYVRYYLDGSVLFATILLMTLIGFFQEVKAKKAMDALKNLSSPKSKVKRDGKVVIINSESVVPGDILILESGDKVAADARLIEVSNLKVNESTLSGESLSVDKHCDVIEGKRTLADQRNMVFMGSTVCTGKATAIVVSTAMQTELGKIATVIQEIKREVTPLQRSIHSIGIWMLIFVSLAMVYFVLTSLYQGMGWLEIFLLGVAASVSAIPESLPVAVTVVFAAGMYTMAKRHAIMRQMESVETLGSTTIICSDKTGTLTHNQMTVRKLYVLGKLIDITGKGKEKHGDFLLGSQKIDPKSDITVRKALQVAALCNDALITAENSHFELIGDPTEAALLIAAAKGGIKRDELECHAPRLDEIPFQSENCYMATLHADDHGRKVLVKGSPEDLLALSCSVLKDGAIVPLTDSYRAEINQAIQAMASEALRLLAVATCDFPTHEAYLKEKNFDGKLIFYGIFGMIDPPRQDAIHAIAECKKAGIKVVMITGDNKATAQAIAGQLGLDHTHVLSGEEIEGMSDEELSAAIAETPLFARIEPLHKLRIVQAFKAQGHIVAMTGDGVNDAPALEAASIGIAMGVTGTEVAKEASDMILSDDNFSSILAAVEEGRAIFNRLRSLIAFMMITCVGELLGLMLTVTFTGVAPLIPLQILWINLVTGVIIAIPLALEPRSGSELKQPPRDPNTSLIYRGMLYRIGTFALLLGLSVFSLFFVSLKTLSLAHARTIVFCSIVIFEWLLAYNLRSDELSIFRLRKKNPYLAKAIVVGALLQFAIINLPYINIPFKTTPLTWLQWGFALLPGLLIFTLESLRKEALPTLFNRGKWKRE